MKFLNDKKKKNQPVGQAFMHSERRHTNVNTDNWRKNV